jgi:hypothetical protein
MQWYNDNNVVNHTTSTRRNAYRYVSSFGVKTAMMQSRQRFLNLSTNKSTITTTKTTTSNDFKTLIDQCRAMKLDGLYVCEKHGIIQVDCRILCEVKFNCCFVFKRVYDQLSQLYASLSPIDVESTRDTMLFDALLRERFWRRIGASLELSIASIEANVDDDGESTALCLPWRHIEAFLSSLVTTPEE